MQLCALGPLEVAAGERRERFGSDTQRLILAVLLAARGAVVSVDRLTHAVWRETPPPSARQSLHSHVSRLRRTLAALDPGGADVVVSDRAGYRVDLASHHLDADRFEALVGQARPLLAVDPRQAARWLGEALALWRGEAFGELAVHDLVRPEAVRLEELRAAAAGDRLDVLLAAGEHQRVVGDLEAAVAADPLAERAHGQLMLALYRSGRQADALAVYRRLRRRLAEELGVDPSPDVHSLHERILQHDPDLAAPPAEAGRRRDATPGADRPIGRDEDVAALATLLMSSSVVTLTGPGGVGKSRLAEAVAAEVGGAFEDGVAVCALAAVGDPSSVAGALVGAVQAQDTGVRSAEETLLTALGTRRLLLVLDNCEHLLEAVAPLVDRIRATCPRTAVLATSRERLRLPGERVWDVHPLSVPHLGAGSAEVADTPAGALFCARAQAAEPSFALTDGNAWAVAELCRRLDGLPLTIELAAARVRALAPADLVARIEDRFEVLTGGPPGETGRHRTLEAVVAWSYELLTEPEALLFERLSVFAGPFPLAAAEQVCAGAPLAEQQVAGLLAELVDKSLVAVDRAGGQMRYRLLDTLRAYGARRLAERGETDRARRAHAEHHLGRAETLGAQVRGPDERDAVAGIDAVIDDLRVAHGWLVTAEQVEGASRLPAALHDDLVFRPRSEVYAWAERALGLTRAEEHPASAAALVTAARGAMDRGELGRARDLAEAALDRAEPATLTVLWALYVLTTASLYEGRLDDALVLAERRVRLAEQLGEDYHQALAHASRALGHRYRGDDHAAAEAAVQARDAAERSGNHTARAWTLYASGEALLDSDPAQAADLLARAIDGARSVQRHFIEGVALVSLASLHGRAGDTSRGLALFREAIALWRRLGNRTNQLTALRNLVEVFARVGADESAAVLHGAVTLGSTPSFGAEARRLAAAWEQVERRLGADAARTAAGHGRHQPMAEVVDGALATLDALLERTVVTRSPADQQRS